LRTGNTGFAIGAESLPENQESDQFGFWVVTKKKNSKTDAAGFAIRSPESAPGKSG
jgi:hypothetical protein